MPKLFDRVRLAREGAAVERAHQHPHLQRYSVGHHSLDVVTLVVLCWKHDHGGELPRAELLVAAAFHDVAERVTGDLPSPIKDRCRDALGEIEKEVDRYLGVDVGLREDEQWYLKSCDKLELYLWAHEEASRGNCRFLGWCRVYEQNWQYEPPPESVKRIVEAVDHAGHIPVLPGDPTDMIRLGLANMAAEQRSGVRTDG